MTKRHLTTKEILKKVEEDRLREEHVREPHLVRFRATQEEIDIREAENAQDVALAQNELQRFGESIARSAREHVRFERYLVRQGFFPGVAADSPLGIAR